MVQCTITPQAIQSPQKYLVGTSKTIIYIPFQAQYCKEPIKYVSQLDNGNALPSFINFREGSFMIQTNDTKIESSYDIKVIGSIQSENLQVETKFKIKIQFPDVPKKFNITTNQSQNSNATKTPVISEDYYSMSTKIKSISQNGIVSVSFNPEFKLLSNDPQKNQQYFNFELSMPNSDDKMDKSQYSFNIVDISKQKMSVQLEFSDPSTISMRVIQIKQDQPNDIPQILTKSNSNSLRIPRQLRRDGLSILFGSNGDQAGSSIKGIIVGNLFFNLFMSTTLQYLWGMINQIQIITHIPLNAVEIPANTKLFFNIIIDISNFNIIPSEDMLNGMMTHQRHYTIASSDSFQRAMLSFSYALQLIQHSYFHIYSQPLIEKFKLKTKRQKIESKVWQFI
eukprot:403347694